MAQKQKNKRKDNEKETNSSMSVLPYVKGLTERVARILKKSWIGMAIMPHTTLCRLLV